jgi:hypothetical protein
VHVQVLLTSSYADANDNSAAIALVRCLHVFSRRFFFSSPTGVQLLHPALRISGGGDEGTLPTSVALVLIAGFCFLERYAAWSLASLRVQHQSARREQRHKLLHRKARVLQATPVAILYMGHTLLHFMVMLLVMSFNSLVFVTVCVAMASAELFYLSRPADTNEQQPRGDLHEGLIAPGDIGEL